jgi:hypothetical protein
MRINLLTGNMSKTAQALISNNLETPLRIQNTVLSTEDDVLEVIEQEIERTNESILDDEHKTVIKVKAKPVE